MKIGRRGRSRHPQRIQRHRLRVITGALPIGKRRVFNGGDDAGLLETEQVVIIGHRTRRLARIHEIEPGSVRAQRRQDIMRYIRPGREHRGSGKIEPGRLARTRIGRDVIKRYVAVRRTDQVNAFKQRVIGGNRRVDRVVVDGSTEDVSGIYTVKIIAGGGRGEADIVILNRGAVVEVIQIDTVARSIHRRNYHITGHHHRAVTVAGDINAIGGGNSVRRHGDAVGGAAAVQIKTVAAGAGARQRVRRHEHRPPGRRRHDINAVGSGRNAGIGEAEIERRDINGIGAGIGYPEAVNGNGRVLYGERVGGRG